MKKAPGEQQRCQRLPLMRAAKEFGTWHGYLLIAMARGELQYEREGDKLFTTADAWADYRRRHPAEPTPLV